MRDVARSRSKEKQSSFFRLLKEMQISLFFLVFGLFLIRIFSTTTSWFLLLHFEFDEALHH